ncbi:MAG: 23S rRNA (guanosine(2251)-2'-O)-methyltransferase RlmB [Myxococcota bacterium]
MSRGEFIYGRHPVREHLLAHSEGTRAILVADGAEPGAIRDLLQIAQRASIPVSRVSRRRLETLIGKVAHQGVVAEIEPFKFSHLEDVMAAADKDDRPALFVVLDQIQDPHNFGAIVRSAFALGAHGVVITKDRSVDVTGAVVKASAGAVMKLPIARVTNLRMALETLKKGGVWVYGTSADAEKPLAELDLSGPVAMVIGNEGKGMRKLVGETCDAIVRVPMVGRLGSLNASVSAGIALYEVARQRSS